MNILHTSTGMVSPGKTNTESPARTSSTGTSMLIASGLITLSDASSVEATTNRDCGDNNDCKPKKKKIQGLLTMKVYCTCK